ncbi:MAG: YdcF family protein [Chromatiaceae bacterium]|nr:YdcF family protein [Chromatiaceae bacterium]
MQTQNSGSRLVDWDAVTTLALTVGTLLITLGGAYLYALHRVLRAARMPIQGAVVGSWLVVPGKRLADSRPDGDFMRRLSCAADLTTGPPARPILILGGLTGDSCISEAEAGERFLRSRPGGQTLRIYRESASRDTLTNLRNARSWLMQEPTWDTVILVSNRYHLARIGLIATSLGIDHCVYPAAPTLATDWPLRRRLLGEAFFWLWFGVGRSWAVLTRNRRMLDRIS